MEIKELLKQSRQLRKSRRHEEAHEFVIKNIDSKNNNFIFENNPIWWSDISAGMCTLSRRSGEDADFIRSAWENKEFLYKFHRHANDLPKEKEELKQLLENEYLALLSESKSIHWIIKDSKGKSHGFLSLVSISRVHRSAEILFGLLDGAPSRLAASAMMILFQFYFKSIKFNKLVSYVYGDNAHSLKGTLNLGFKKEGHLRCHVLDPKTNKFVDLIQTGLLIEDAFSPENDRVMRRLLR